MKLVKYRILRKYDIRTSKEEQRCDLDALLKTLALQCKVNIIVPKLKADVVNLWTKKVPHWSSLDPYSSLKESFSDSNQDNEVPVNMPESSRVYFTTIGGHVLCKRHRNYSSTHACREQTKYTFYRDMCSDRTDKPKCT